MVVVTSALVATLAGLSLRWRRRAHTDHLEAAAVRKSITRNDRSEQRPQLQHLALGVRTVSDWGSSVDCGPAFLLGRNVNHVGLNLMWA